MAATDAADTDPLALAADVDDVAARQVRQAGQDLTPTGYALLVEPDEVLVVAFDEDRRPRSCTVLGEPDREVPGAVVLARGLVYAVGIGPDAEVADVEHVVKAHAQRFLEGEDIGVEPIDGSMDVASGADEHDFLVVLPMNPRPGVQRKIVPEAPATWL